MVIINKGQGVNSNMKHNISLNFTGKINFFKKIELFFWYLWGFSCVFIIPYIEVMKGVRIKFVEISTVLVMVVLFIRITVGKRSNSKKNINFLLLLNVFLYCFALFWPLGGVLTIYNLGYKPSLPSYIAPFRRLTVILILFIAYVYFKYEEWLLRERALIRGFLAGCVVTTVWMIIEQVTFLFFQIPLNEVIFKELLKLDPGHSFINLIGLGLSKPLYRATGFAWDPGQIAPMVALGWLCYNLLPEALVGKKRLFISVFMLLTLPLSLSRTAIMGTAIITFGFLGINFVVGIIQVSLIHKKKCHITVFHRPEVRFYWRSSVLGCIVAVILIIIVCISAKMSTSSFFQGLAFYLRSTLESQTYGEQRHQTYYKLIPYAWTFNWSTAFLGYGTGNSGVAMEKVGWDVLPGIEKVAAKRQGNWVPESTTVSFALMGGMISSLALIFCVITSIARVSNWYLRKPWNNISLLGYATILLAPFIFGLGYGIDNTIIYISIFLMLINIWDPKLRNISKNIMK